MENKKPKYRVRKVSEMTSITTAPSKTVLLKVKRERDSEPLDAVELEFDNRTGTLKRQKLITEQQALIDNFHSSMNFTEE
jgi:hypothetical protein